MRYYFEKMLKDERFVGIYENRRVIGMLFFSICNDPNPYLNNIDHDYIEHDINGKILVIDDMVCGKFNLSFLKSLNKSFLEKFPNLEKMMWRRRGIPVDRIKVFNMRGNYVIKH